VAKNHILGQILTFGDSCTDPFYRRGPNLTSAKFRLDRFILSLSGGVAKDTNFTIFDFVILWCRQPVGGDLRKLNMNAQQQTFPYPTVSKSFL